MQRSALTTVDTPSSEEATAAERASFSKDTVIPFYISANVPSLAGGRYKLLVPLSMFHALCARLGNECKAGGWIMYRFREVDALSREAIEGYLNLMVRSKLGLDQEASSLSRIMVSVIDNQTLVGRSEHVH